MIFLQCADLAAGIRIVFMGLLSALPPYQGLPFMGLLARGNWGRREHHRAPGS